MLVHKFVHSYLDKHTSVTYPTPGRRIAKHDKGLQEKHFNVSRHPMKNCCVICAYKKKPSCKNRNTKTSIFCKKYQVLFAKIISRTIIPKANVDENRIYS